MPLDQTDLTILEGEARVADSHIQNALGYGRINDLHRIIRKHEDELSAYGVVLCRTGKKPPEGTQGGRPSLTYYLNEAQATLVCMFSRTGKAAEARRLIVEVFTAWRQGRLGAAADAPVPGMVQLDEDRYIRLLGRHIELLEAERTQLADAMMRAMEDARFWSDRWRALSDQSRRDLDASLRARDEASRGWPVSTAEARGIAALFAAGFTTSEISEITRRSDCTVRRYRAGGGAA